jgi:hypothetical protein
MNDHPDEIARFIAGKSAGQCSIIFLHDPALTYVLNEAALGRPWTVVSVSGDPIHGIASGDVNLKCLPAMEFVIQSYTGDKGVVAARLDQILEDARESMTPVGSERFGRDDQVALKRRLPGLGDAAKSLPDYRFEVSYGAAREGVAWGNLASVFRWDKPVSVSVIR